MDIRSIAFNKESTKETPFEIKDSKLSKFFSKNEIRPEDIKYILRESDKTSIYLSDERVISTYITANDIVGVLPEDMFYNINRGTYVALAYIANINQNVYTMMDEREITGRAYHMEEHEKNKTHLLNRRLNHKVSKNVPIRESFSGLDNLPISFCVIEVLFETNGRHLDFIIKYCNKAMEPLTGFSINQMLNHSVYDLYEGGEKSRLVTYADVAINGEIKTLERMVPDFKKKVKIICFQPKEGFCGCLIEDMESPITKLLNAK